MVCVVSAAALFFGNGYAPMEDIKVVHWMWVLGFTFAMCKNVVLTDRNSTVVDSVVLLTVQPNLRCCRGKEASPTVRQQPVVVPPYFWRE